MTIPLGEPIKIGNRDVRLGFWGMPRNPGDPQRTNGTFTLIDGEGDVVLDVFMGPKGDPGEPMPPWDVEWDSTITNIGDLPEVDTLGEDDNGRAWVIGTRLYVYVHDLGGYRSIEAGIPGPRGLTPDISITGELIEAADPDNPYGEFDVEPYGTLLEPGFKLKIPGLRGPQGPSTNIRLAPDYYNALPPLDGQGVVWDESLGKFRPGDLSPTAVQLYTIPQSDFDAQEFSSGRQLIASQNIEEKAWAWYPDVNGFVPWKRSGFTLSPAQVEIEVRIGDTGVGTGETAPLCGLGRYDPSTLDAVTVSNIFPCFSDVGNPSRALAPDTAAGRVPAGQAKTIYVFAHRIAGSGNYTILNDPAQVTIRVTPVS